jgi:hypothetical protein
MASWAFGQPAPPDGSALVGVGSRRARGDALTEKPPLGERGLLWSCRARRALRADGVGGVGFDGLQGNFLGR